MQNLSWVYRLRDHAPNIADLKARSVASIIARSVLCSRNSIASFKLPMPALP